MKKQARFVLLTSSSGYNCNFNWTKIKTLAGMDNICFDTILSWIDTRNLDRTIINAKSKKPEKKKASMADVGKKPLRKAKSKADKDSN
jgi:hypothetical protein